MSRVPASTGLLTPDYVHLRSSDDTCVKVCVLSAEVSGTLQIGMAATRHDTPQPASRLPNSTTGPLYFGGGAPCKTIGWF